MWSDNERQLMFREFDTEFDDYEYGIDEAEVRRRDHRGAVRRGPAQRRVASVARPRTAAAVRDHRAGRSFLPGASRRLPFGRLPGRRPLPLSRLGRPRPLPFGRSGFPRRVPFRHFGAGRLLPFGRRWPWQPRPWGWRPHPGHWRQRPWHWSRRRRPFVGGPFAFPAASGLAPAIFGAGVPDLQPAIPFEPTPSQMPSPLPPSSMPASPADMAPGTAPGAIEGTEHVRWLQSSLNQVLNLQLPINGIVGPETRSAIRGFQERAGLPADGFAGPDTVQALAAARGGATAGSANAGTVQAPATSPPASGGNGSAAASGAPAGEYWFGETGPAPRPGIATRRPRIEDRTQLPSTRATRRKHQIGRRDRSKVDALVLHQMACCRRRKEGGYDTIGAHFAILEDGRILQLHPIEANIAASNGFNARSVAVEFAGNFPNTQGKCWQPRCKKPPCPDHGCHQLTRAQIEAGRYLIEHLMREIKLTHVLAHRQANGTNRSNDPGPDIWFHVAQWAIEKHGLRDGGPGFRLTYSPALKSRFPHLTDGLPIPDEWRNWGRRSGRQRP